MKVDERFFAWLDGELEPAEATEMEARVAESPELSRLAKQHRALGAQLHRAFDPIATAPVPDRIQAAVCPSAAVIDLAAARRARFMPSLPQWSAMAAMLAVGMFLGTMVPRQANAPVEVQGGKLFAAAAVKQALDSELASAPSGDVRIGLTFRDRAGDICRSFTTAASSGLACREDGRWQLRGLFAAPEGQTSDYRMAAGMEPNLAALVDSTMAGDAFGAAAEKAAKDKGWR